MSIITYDQFEQGTDLWFLARLGRPTASCFGIMMAKGVKDERSKTRENYIRRLTAELMTGKPVETYRNQHMLRGQEQEPEALEAYKFKTENDVRHVGFVFNDEIGCGASPDGLIDTAGGVEIKTVSPEIMVELLCTKAVPQQYLPQVHGCMWVTGRQWWEIAIYSPGFKIFHERIERSSSTIEEMDRYRRVFLQELEAKVFTATEGLHTFKALRLMRDEQFSDALDEVATAQLLPWPKPMAQAPSITEKLRASLALEE